MSDYMDEKIKRKQEKLIEMTTLFCKDHLNEQYGELSVKLVEKMGRKHDVPFKRGRLDIWASGVIYALAQVNFLFNKTSPNHISADDICGYFGTKKSTVSNKASIISDMFNLTPFDKEFSLNSHGGEHEYILDDKSDMDDFFNEVYELFYKGNSEEALKKLDTIEPDNPEYPRSLFYKSVILSNLGDSSAEELFMQSLIGEAIKAKGDEFIDDEDYISYFNKGLDEYNSGNYEDALYSFNVSLGLEPNQSEALYYKAITLGRLFEFDEAIEVIDRAIELDSCDDRFWNDKANFLVCLQQYDKAIECFDKALELNPEDSVIFANKGFMYLQIENYDDALKNYNEACKLEKTVHNYVGLSNVYVEMSDFANAEKYLKKASEIDDGDIEYLTAMGQFMMMEDNLEESLNYFDKVLKVNPNHAEIWLFKSMIYAQMNNESEADKCLKKVFEINPMILEAFEEMLK